MMSIKKIASQMDSIKAIIIAVITIIAAIYGISSTVDSKKDMERLRQEHEDRELQLLINQQKNERNPPVDLLPKRGKGNKPARGNGRNSK